MNTQRNGKNVEERRTERVQVTTRETLTSRARSPDRKPAPPMQQERTKVFEPSKTFSAETRPKSSKSETPQGMSYSCPETKTILLIEKSTMETRGYA